MNLFRELYFPLGEPIGLAPLAASPALALPLDFSASTAETSSSSSSSLDLSAAENSSSSLGHDLLGDTSSSSLATETKGEKKKKKKRHGFRRMMDIDLSQELSQEMKKDMTKETKKMKKETLDFRQLLEKFLASDIPIRLQHDGKYIKMFRDAYQARWKQVSPFRMMAEMMNEVEFHTGWCETIFVRVLELFNTCFPSPEEKLATTKLLFIISWKWGSRITNIDDLTRPDIRDIRDTDDKDDWFTQENPTRSYEFDSLLGSRAFGRSDPFKFQPRMICVDRVLH